MRWKLAAVSGWGAAALWFWTAYRLVIEEREEAEAYSDHGQHDAPLRSRPQPVVIRRPQLWGEHLAQEAEALIALGFEDQAAHLFAASGELLDRSSAA